MIYTSNTPEKKNEKVLNNLHYLIEHGKNEQIIVRTPIIPVYNSESDVDNSIRLLKEMVSPSSIGFI